MFQPIFRCWDYELPKLYRVNRGIDFEDKFFITYFNYNYNYNYIDEHEVKVTQFHQDKHIFECYYNTVKRSPKRRLRLLRQEHRNKKKISFHKT